MKWIVQDGIKFERGNKEVLIARFNEDGAWFTLRAQATQQTQKSEFKRLGETLGAKSCEVKKYYDDNDIETETEVIVFMSMYDGSWRFYVETPQRLEPVDYEPITHFFQD